MIRDRSQELDTFYTRHFAERMGKRPVRANGHHSELTDEEVIALAKGAKNAEKFEALWGGDTSGYASPSEADQALVSLLAFYTQDEAQLDSLYRRSGLCREKWLKRSGYRGSTINKALSNLSETYVTPDDGARMVVRNGHAPFPSPSPSLYKGEGRGRKPKLVRFSDVKPPGPRRYVLHGLVLEAYVTLLHGDGGVAKSLLALALALAVSGDSDKWLGRSVEGGPVLYLDFELDSEEQARRVYQLCRGSGIEKPPENLLYMSAVGHTARAAFEAATAVCKERGVKLLVLDSHGVAMQGDAEAARDTIGFFVERIEPLRALGVAVLIIDHQSKMQAGQSYQSKGAFGSVFKSNLARSVIQAEATERGEGTLTVRLRQKKHNFGPLADPFGVKLAFSEESVGVEVVELDSAQMAEEATLTAPERIKLILQDGPLYPSEISEATGVPLKTIKNSLTGLKKQGTIEPTGEKEDREERVRLIVPTSQSPKGDGTRDDRSRPLSADLLPGQSATLDELRERRAGSGGAAKTNAPRTRSANVRALLSKPPGWLQDQMDHCRKQGSPENQLKALAASVAAEMYDDTAKAAEVLSEVEAFMTHGIGCDCEACL